MDFESGKSDGMNGGLNKNVGNVVPSFEYQIGYAMGTKYRLLEEMGVYTNHDDYQVFVNHPYGTSMSVPWEYSVKKKERGTEGLVVTGWSGKWIGGEFVYIETSEVELA